MQTRSEIQMPQKDAAWHDRMYNNRALVPDFADHFAHWQNASAQARERLKGQLDLPYGDGPGETLDIFPAAQPNAPVVIFIHGGYWRSLDKSDHSFVAPALHDMGACVVVVNYALCPGTPEQPITIPDIALQMAKATAWLGRHIAEYGGDRSNITVIGHSAGGHLAAMLLGCDWKNGAAICPLAWCAKLCPSRACLTWRPFGKPRLCRVTCASRPLMCACAARQNGSAHAWVFCTPWLEATKAQNSCATTA